MNYKVLSCLFLSLALFYSCGKDIENSDKKKPDRGEQGGDPPNVTLDGFIEKQKLICEDFLFCPENIAKLVVVADEKISYCTATLIDNNKIITSASCLPRSFRIPNIDCSSSVFAIFPKTAFTEEERVACRKVDFVDNNLFTEPALWKNDIAVISLSNSVNREVSTISPDGIKDNEDMVTWKVDYISDYMGIVRKDECRSIFNSYLNPFTENRFSPMFVGSRCNFEEGNAGSPIFRGDELVGIYSKEMSSRIYNYLENSGVLTGELGRYYHFSNLACTNYKFEKMFFDKPKLCNIEITTNKLDTLRGNILKGKSIHQATMEELESQIEIPKKYFSWDVEFVPDERLTTFESHLIKPKCIFKSNDWIGEYRRWRSIRTYAKIMVETPYYVFKTRLDEFLRSKSVVENAGTKISEIEFNPYAAHVEKSTYVTITSELHGKPSKITYETVKANCP